MTLSNLQGHNTAPVSCFNYGIVHGCDEHCPALIAGECKYYPTVKDFLSEEDRLSKEE